MPGNEKLIKSGNKGVKKYIQKIKKQKTNKVKKKHRSRKY